MAQFLGGLGCGVALTPHRLLDTKNGDRRSLSLDYCQIPLESPKSPATPFRPLDGPHSVVSAESFLPFASASSRVLMVPETPRIFERWRAR